MMTMDTVPPPLPIDWHNGMLLAPEHFQVLADRVDALSQYYVRQVMPFHWGIIELRVDPLLLLQGTLSIDYLDAVLPDGLVISAAGEDGELRLDLTTREQDFRGGPLMVHVVAARSRGYAKSQSRFKSVESRPEPFGDELGDEEPLPLLAPRLELWMGANPPSRFVSIPLIEIESRQDGFAVTAFQPPVPQLQTARELVSEISDLALDIRKKAMAVLEDSNGSFAEASQTSSLDARAIIAALSAELPCLEAIISCAGATPLELHRSLLRVAGRLAVLGNLMVPPTFGAYQHNALNSCFRPIIDFIRLRLNSIRLQTQEIPFAVDGDQFQLPVQANWVDQDSLLIGLRCYSDGAQSEAAAWFEAAIIAPCENVETHIANRTTGADRRSVSRDDGLRLAANGDLLLYRVDWPHENRTSENSITVLNRLNSKGQRPPRSIVLFVAPASDKVGS